MRRIIAIRYDARPLHQDNLAARIYRYTFSCNLFPKLDHLRVANHEITVERTFLCVMFVNSCRHMTKFIAMKRKRGLLQYGMEQQ